MLYPAQVVPFLNHDDPLVRELALRYFDRCHDPGQLTADDFWAVIDARGESPETLSFATHLKDAPWTEPAFHRLLQALQLVVMFQ